jgi:hypothetical protein
MRRRPPSAAQRQCIIEATIEPLAPFRRGYARSKFGPFYEPRTIQPLLRDGSLRLVNRQITALSSHDRGDQ